MRRMISGFIGTLGKKLAELIGGPQRTIRRWANITSTYQSRDSGTGDYAFWDRARRGLAQGLGISGLLLKPLESKIAAWTLGKMPGVKMDNTNAAERINKWLHDIHSQVLEAYEEAVGLGDCYLIINADLSVTVKSPNVVRPMVGDNDFGRIVGWIVEERYPHPTEPGRYQTQRDIYTATERTRTIETDGATSSSQTFRNFINRIPVIHIPNRKAADAMFGRPEGEALVELLQSYGEVIDSAIVGNMRQGRPTPAIEKVGDQQAVNAIWERYGTTVTRTLPDGSTETYTELDFDSDKLLILGGDATFNWRSPSAFMNDVEKLLGLLFYLYLEHVEMPEWVMGNAIASSKASAQTQVEPLVKFIEKKQGQAEGWIKEAIEVGLAYMGLSDVTLRNAGEIEIVWDDLTTEDGKLTKETIEWAHSKGLITDETAVRLMPVDVDNPEDEVKAAQKQQAEKKAAFDAVVDQRMAEAERAARDAEANANDDEEMPEPPVVVTNNGRMRRPA